MTTVQRVAQVFGAVFLLVGILGFVSGSATMQTGHLLGLFPVNAVHNVVHILFGIWGLAASRSFAGARSYARAGGVIYVLLAVCGLFIPDGFGLVPLGGNDVWLHAALGLILAVVGFTTRDTTVGVQARPAL